jgi:competence protein ComEA
MLDMSEIPRPQGWRERLETIAGRRRETAVVAGLVAASVFGGLGLWARGAPAQIAPPAIATPAPSGTPIPSGLLLVHVAGAVRDPGVVEVAAGSRVADAIELAGGALPKADLDQLNLAAVVVDASQILVPFRGGVASAGVSPAPSASGATVVDLNTADQAMLETIPGLGPVKAGAIIAYRTEIGGFTSIDQLLEVSGIGPATLDSIRPFVSV